MHLWMLKCSSAGSGTQQLWQLRVPPWNSWEQEDWYIVKHNGETVRISHWNLDLMSLVVWKVPFALRNMKSNAKGRCANTGKRQSCGQKGDLPQKPDSWKHGSMEGDIPTASTRHDAAHRPDWSSAGAVALELRRSCPWSPKAGWFSLVLSQRGGCLQPRPLNPPATSNHVDIP